MGFPVFFASFFAAAIPALLYENSFFPTFGMIVLSTGKDYHYLTVPFA